MMLAAAREHARILRALIAVCAAAALCVVLFVQEQDRAEGKQRAIYIANSTLWKLSELIFETQRFSQVLLAYEHALASRDAVEFRFDILYSRLDVMANAQLGEWGPIKRELSAFETYIAQIDPLIFSDAGLTKDQSAQIREDLAALVIQARHLWVEVFAGSNAAVEAINALVIASGDRTYRVLTTVLISLLMLYVLAELYFANRAHRSERSMHAAAAQASAAKSRFLANVSHEIRTPLNGILGMATELGESELTPDQAACLKVIEQSGGVLLSTINDVLDLSKVESGKFHVEMRPFRLKPALEAACSLYSALAKEKGLTLSLTVQDNLPPVLRGDERRIQQVMHNLIANAVKFTEHGSVTVKAVPEHDAEGVVLSVRDTGPGIPEEARERIFQPFVQADASITRNFGGTGLGLSISRQLCEAMGGALSVVSRPGSGTTFYCSLPMTAAAETDLAGPDVAVQSPPDLSDWTIVLADDNATNRLILRRYLQATGARLRDADSGAQALEIVSETTVDLVLMDIQMPRMDGITAARAIREMEAERAQRATCIIAVTANVLSHQVQEYKASGMQEVLPKPVSKKALIRLLNGLVDHARAA